MSPPVVWDVLEDTLHDFIVAATGLPVTQVFWAHEDVARPAEPFVTLELLDLSSPGLFDESVVIDNPAPVPGEEILLQTYAQSELLLRVMVYAKKTIGSTGGRAVGVKIRNALSQESRLDDLDFAGIAVIDRGEVRPIPDIFEQEWEGRSLLDVRLRFLDGTEEGVTFIETVDIHGNFIGLFVPPVAPGGSGAMTSTTAPLDLYVHQFGGSDSNPGTQDLPFKTMAKLASAIPDRVLHTVVGHVYRGTYVENWSITNIIGAGGSITIQNEEWDLAGGLAGPNVGTIISTSDYTHQTADSTYIVNELRGKFLEIQSGALAGKRYPIRANGTNNIEAAIISSSLNGASYRIIESATSLVPLDTNAYNVFLAPPVVASSSFLVLKGFKIRGGTLGVKITNRAQLIECAVTDQTGLSIDLTRSVTTTVQGCFVAAADGVNGAIPYAADSCNTWILVGSILRGPGNTGTSRSMTARGTLAANCGDATLPTFIEHSTTGMVMSGPGRLTGNRTVIQDIGTGFFVYGMQGGWIDLTVKDCLAIVCNIDSTNLNDAGGGTSLLFHNALFQVAAGAFGVFIGPKAGATALKLIHGSRITGGKYGIWSQSPFTYVELEDPESSIDHATTAGVLFEGGTSHFTLNGGKINDNAIGLQMLGDHCGISVISGNTFFHPFPEAPASAEIRNNTSAGVDFSARSCAYDSFISHPTLLMDGNGADFKYNSVGGVSTLANLRSIVTAPTKTISDAGTFNRLSES